MLACGAHPQRDGAALPVPALCGHLARFWQQQKQQQRARIVETAPAARGALEAAR